MWWQTVIAVYRHHAAWKITKMQRLNKGETHKISHSESECFVTTHYQQGKLTRLTMV